MTQVLPPQSAEGETRISDYLDQLIHGWLKTLTILGFTLIPIFFVLDVFMMPRDLLPRFAGYRLAATAIIIAQYFSIRSMKPNPRSFLHAFVFSLVAGSMIALMTTDLGGFNSTYYAGLNLVMCAVNLLMPWAAIYSAINTVVIIGIYVLFNLAVKQAEPIHSEILVNNLYFLAAMGVITGAINHVKQTIIIQEFNLRADLKRARDALWGEMEIAKHIQTALLPSAKQVNGYDVAALMQPADEVGGDYYDLVETPHGEAWVCIGDVSGHGVESGLIMMMTQTSIFTAINRAPDQKPSDVLNEANVVLKKNISRLGGERYVTCMAMRLGSDRISFSGKHQDVFIYRARSGTIERVVTEGVWLGLVDDIRGKQVDDSRTIEEDDVILLYTDGVTEAMDASRKMYGEDRLSDALARSARLGVDAIVSAIMSEVKAHTSVQRDDVTVVAIKRRAAARAGT